MAATAGTPVDGLLGQGEAPKCRQLIHQLLKQKPLVLRRPNGCVGHVLLFFAKRIEWKGGGSAKRKEFGEQL